MSEKLQSERLRAALSELRAANRVESERRRRLRLNFPYGDIRAAAVSNGDFARVFPKEG